MCIKDSISFKSPISVDNGSTNTYQGEFLSTMDLHVDSDGEALGVEWDNPVDTVWIGLWSENKSVQGYDGVFELPKQVEELLIKNGFSIDEL